MNGITWLILVCASACSVTSLFASSTRTGMSRLDARELYRRQLLIRVLQSNLSQRIAARQRLGGLYADAFTPPGDPEQPAPAGPRSHKPSPP
ncbi:hypothetical protein [Streptomyces ficellus]|uniref:Uncharacterized protein n=1 Tax=Streptomyces ficellus TaxID=1977088 RepID=A0A6I6FSW8_9ACTN|nr:hypothetical protein [Streptomyces ficellus]QGV80076.1 hypothetical protein EIZ62_18915 [Streptomyces ficellus]